MQHGNAWLDQVPRMLLTGRGGGGPRVSPERWEIAVTGPIDHVAQSKRAP